MRDAPGNSAENNRHAVKEGERLASCALIRDGQVHAGFRQHWELRASLGDEEPSKARLTDTYGFWTTEDRFVDRAEAATIAYVCGQSTSRAIELLSSEIDWDGRPRTTEKPKRKLWKEPRRRFRP